MPRLKIIHTSTREQRVGLPVAHWFVEQAREHAKFEVDSVDLRAVNLPLLDEPQHPMKRSYQHDHTKAWSKTIAEADAFAFVMPEYNYGMPPAMLNAIDYLYFEWCYKPAGFVSYGGASGGVRSVQMAKPVLTSVKVMPIPEGVALPFFAKQIDDQGRLAPGEAAEKAAATMLDELARWSAALATLRA